MKKVWKQGKRSDSMETNQRWSLRIIKVRDGAQGSLKINSKAFAIPILTASDGLMIYNSQNRGSKCFRIYL